MTHVDGSARVQTVSSESNQRLYYLLKEFNELTQCPVLVNTSFNIRGEPIVCNPQDAVRCFMGTNLDILVCGNFVAFKKDQDPSLRKDYRNKFKLD